MHYIYAINAKTDMPVFAIHLSVIPRVGEEIELNGDKNTYIVKKVVYRVSTNPHCMDVIIYVNVCSK